MALESLLLEESFNNGSCKLDSFFLDTCLGYVTDRRILFPLECLLSVKGCRIEIMKSSTRLLAGKPSNLPTQFV
jgi:hypothetical protein